MTEAARARSDDEIIDELARALRYERERASTDLLVILAGAIAIGAVLCLTTGVWAGEGVAQVVLLNLSTELAGALVTVILIGALWQQVRRTAFGGVEALSRAAQDRRQHGLSAEERLAFERVIEIHRRTASSPPVIRQVRALAFTITHRHDLAALERVIQQGRPA